MKLKTIYIASTALALSFASVSSFAGDYAAALSADPANYSGECPAKITFKGRIKADKAGKVQYRFIRSDGANAPIQSLTFTTPGSQQISTTWTLGGPGLPHYEGWQAVEILYPQKSTSQRATFEVTCQFPKPEITAYRFTGQCLKKGAAFAVLGSHFGTPAGKGIALGGNGIHIDLPVINWTDTHIKTKLPNDPAIEGGKTYYVGVEKDNHSAWLSNISKSIKICPERQYIDLQTKIDGVSPVLHPGSQIGSGARVIALNTGNKTAPGTVGVIDPANGFMIDWVLSTDQNVPNGFAAYSANYKEDVLLKGGRTSNTKDLVGGGAETYPEGNATIPSDTPPGNYFICTQIDPANKVMEANENNNVTCVRVKVKAKLVPVEKIKATTKAPMMKK